MYDVTATQYLHYPLFKARQWIRHPYLFTSLPKVVEVQPMDGELRIKHLFVFPLLGERSHLCRCSLQDIIDTEIALDAKGWVEGELISIAIHWHFLQQEEGMRITFRGQYTVQEGIIEELVNALRQYSPLPIRSDADAILSRGFDRLLKEELETYSREYLAKVCTQLITGWPGKGEHKV